MGDVYVRTRSYQLEMFERSMAENIIVAMDTGSGKTHMYVLSFAFKRHWNGPQTQRLETYPAVEVPANCPSLVWFLAPHVELCNQQYRYLRSGLPAIKAKLLVGSDNVDKWKEKRTWDAALDQVRLVISTPQILEDALTHGFVGLEAICLMVFDEAHHCARKHPANQIMQRFYHPRKRDCGSGSVPCILGLTASPINTKIKIIESNLDAVAVTPQTHRDELMTYVHRPELVRLVYTVEAAPVYGPALHRLQEICAESVGPRPSRDPDLPPSAPASRKETFASPLEEQLSLFQRKAEYLCRTLGSWSAEYFVLESVKTLTSLSDENHDIFFLWARDERSRLVDLLGRDERLGELEKRRDAAEFLVSDKVAALLSFLDRIDVSTSKTLIFVEQRVTASVLSVLLGSHPSGRGRFQCAPFVGLSHCSRRKCRMPELLSLNTQSQALTEFRDRGKNVVVATNALEEGIDVQTCNAVVCFDLPQNVRSFIQRRGRARTEKSVFALLFEDQESLARLDDWQELEHQLQLSYQDTLRDTGKGQVQAADDACVDFVLESPSTGAKLAAKDALAHLYHFCQSLPPQAYTDLRPVFSFTRTDPDGQSIRAVVTLPNCVDPGVRRTRSQRAWDTERAAAIDAAFQCYKALYEARLLNANLLPQTHDVDIDLPQLEHLGATTEIDAEFNPWIGVRRSWSCASLHSVVTTCRFRRGRQQQEVVMVLTLPCEPPPLSSLRASWDLETTIDLIFSSTCRQGTRSSSELHVMKRITHLISRSTHSDLSVGERDDFLLLFTPFLPSSTLSDWLHRNSGRVPLVDSPESTVGSLKLGFLRNVRQGGRPELFQGWVPGHRGGGPRTEVTAIPFTKRRDFSSPAGRQPQTSKARTLGREDRQVHQYRADECTIDRLPAEVGRLNLLLPLIHQHFQDSWTVELLLNTVLDGVPCADTGLILAALTPPALQRKPNYEALEFLGDSVIKLVVSAQLYDQHPNWPEGFLSRKRASLVSNEHLARGALAVGLAPFIPTKPTSWRKWRPTHLSDLDEESTSPRAIRTKVLADVVEALVGATFMDGGLEAARLCIRNLVPATAVTLPTSDTRLPDDWRDGNVTGFEAVVGYRFRHAFLLVEALTHPSFEHDPLVQSYQRLEFLGDAVLDAIVASRLMQHRRKRRPGDMTRIKAAIANVDFLGFFCLEFAHSTPSTSVQPTPLQEYRVVRESRTVHLWQLIRCKHEMIRERCVEAVARMRSLGPSIRQQLDAGPAYPWVQLVTLGPDKFFSDIVESLIGAIYVDSGGSLGACAAFLTRVGIMAYLERLVEEDVDVVHPRTKLDWKTGSRTVSHEVMQSRETEKYACVMNLDGTALVRVDGHESSQEAIVTAAQHALLKLRDAAQMQAADPELGHATSGTAVNLRVTGTHVNTGR